LLIIQFSVPSTHNNRTYMHKLCQNLGIVLQYVTLFYTLAITVYKMLLFIFGKKHTSIVYSQIWL